MEENKTTAGNVVYETVPEASVEPENSAPQENTPDSFSPSDFPPAVHEESKAKYLVIGIFVIIFIFIFIVIIRFFTSGKKTEPQKISLNYWGLWEEEEIFQPLIDAYKRKNPQVEIDYKKLSPKDYRQKLLARDEKTRDRPDIFRFHNTWLPTIKEILTPLPKNLLTNEQFEKTFYPIAKTDLKLNDSYMGLPLEIDGLVLIYNNELFKKAGLETAPSTWDEVVDFASRLTVTQEGKIITSGIALGTATNVSHFSDILGWMILQNGGDLMKINSDEGVDALESYRRFSEPPNNVWDENMPNSTVAFMEGKVAMIIAPSWAILEIKTVRPDLDLKSSPLPIIPGGKQISLASYWVEGVSKYSKNQLEAWKFLIFLIEKENMTTLYEQMAKTRLFGEPYSRVDLGATLVQNEYIGPIIQQAPNMKSLPVISRTYDDGINDKIGKYLEDAINSRSRGVSSKEALTTAAQGISQILNLYGIK